MARTENIELTVICLIYRENRILLQNRVKEDWKGYTLPGGHVEEGESIVDAVIREMKEGSIRISKFPDQSVVSVSRCRLGLSVLKSVFYYRQPQSFFP